MPAAAFAAPAVANTAQTGGASYQTPTPTPPPAPAKKAQFAPDGTVVPPANAPEAVKKMIAAANRIHDKPYRYGGGHGSFRDSAYDCSGSLSYVLRAARLLKSPLDSSGLGRWGRAGKGKWVTVYAHAGHAYMMIAGIRFDTSGRRDDGTRWDTRKRPTSGYKIRHFPGL